MAGQRIRRLAASEWERVYGSDLPMHSMQFHLKIFSLTLFFIRVFPFAGARLCGLRGMKWLGP